MKDLNEHYADSLFKAVLELQSLDECRRFFADLCTASELRSMSRRIEVAKMLNDKRIYTDISKETGASSATISRVSRCLTRGDNGYNIVLKRSEETENGNLQ